MKSRETLTIRTCVVDGGSKLTDTEFARRDPATVVSSTSWESHGQFRFVRHADPLHPENDTEP